MQRRVKSGLGYRLFCITINRGECAWHGIGLALVGRGFFVAIKTYRWKLISSEQFVKVIIFRSLIIEKLFHNFERKVLIGVGKQCLLKQKLKFFVSKISNYKQFKKQTNRKVLTFWVAPPSFTVNLSFV